MKRIKLIALLLLPFLLNAQKGFEVRATLKDLGAHAVKFSYLKNGKFTVDTISPNKKGIIIWEGFTEEPQFARMEVIDSSLLLRVGKAVSSQPALMFLLDNSKIKIEGDSKYAYKSAISTKNKEILSYEKYRLVDIAGTDETWSLQKEYNRKAIEKDTAGNAAIMAKMGTIRKQYQQIRIKFIEDNPQAFASILMLQNLFLVMSVPDLDDHYNKLDDKYKNTKAAKVLYAKIESNKKTAIGKPAVNFKLPGVDGKPVELTSLIGKVVLIDFWGSWCVPCRKSHPALKELYAKYKSKGFEIVGISNESAGGSRPRDIQEKNWKKAIEEDGIDWLHVLHTPEIIDLVKEYDINAYPTKYLIDRNGKILMKILGSSESMHQLLEKKMAELFSE